MYVVLASAFLPFSLHASDFLLFQAAFSSAKTVSPVLCARATGDIAKGARDTRRPRPVLDFRSARAKVFFEQGEQGER